MRRDPLPFAFVGAAVGVILMSMFVGGFQPQLVDAVKRGWFEHRGKIYRVVPAEVR